MGLVCASQLRRTGALADDRVEVIRSCRTAVSRVVMLPGATDESLFALFVLCACLPSMCVASDVAVGDVSAAPYRFILNDQSI